MHENMDDVSCRWNLVHMRARALHVQMFHGVCAHLLHQVLQLLLDLEHGVSGLHVQEDGGLLALHAHVHRPACRECVLELLLLEGSCCFA